jgi:hypothetical protein
MMVGLKEVAGLHRPPLLDRPCIKTFCCKLRAFEPAALQDRLAYSARLDCSTGTPGPIVEDTEIFFR